MITETINDGDTTFATSTSCTELDTYLRERIGTLSASLRDALPADAQVLAFAAVVVSTSPDKGFATTHIVAGDTFMIRAGLAEANRLGAAETTG